MNTTTPAARSLPQNPGLIQAIRARWQLGSVLVRDGIGAIALMALSLLPLGIGGLRLGELYREFPLWVSVALVIAQTLPLVLRRGRPALTLLVVGIAFATVQALGADTGLAGLGLLIALYSCAAHLTHGRVVVAAASAVGYGILVAILVAEKSPEAPIDWVTFAAVLAVPWIAGELVRRRRVDQAAIIERAAAEADRAARAILARDLHDIVTHHVTAMVVQAESAGYLAQTSEGDTDRDGILAAVGSTGRLALTELRSLLGALDPDAAAAGDPAGRADAAAQTPHALSQDDAVEHMVRRLRATGYPISLELVGTVDEIPAAIMRVMRSVAREAVTNAMKHARGTDVRLVISASTRVFELAVTNAIPADARKPTPGRGTMGMASRVEDAGGILTADSTGGRYATTARWSR